METTQAGSTSTGGSEATSSATTVTTTSDPWSDCGPSEGAHSSGILAASEGAELPSLVLDVDCTVTGMTTTMDNNTDVDLDCPEVVNPDIGVPIPLVIHLITDPLVVLPLSEGLPVHLRYRFGNQFEVNKTVVTSLRDPAGKLLVAVVRGPDVYGDFYPPDFWDGLALDFLQDVCPPEGEDLCHRGAITVSDGVGSVRVMDETRRVLTGSTDFVIQVGTAMTCDDGGIGGWRQWLDFVIAAEP
jgi:hypothetical protein